MRWIDQFSVLLLDMNGTFMFGHDRLGPEEDFLATYLRCGGHRLQRDELSRVMRATCDALLDIYERPERFDDFPALSEALRDYGHVAEAEIPFLESVFAAHEIGHVPLEYATFLTTVAKTHKLGIVSNICAKPNVWRELLETNGLLSLFDTIVFSSEGRSIKPSLALFERARRSFPADAKIVFVGDSLERDVIPAKNLGFSTAWIAPQGSTHPSADRVVATLLEMEELVG